MSFKELCLAITLSSTFALVACGDDSSSSSGETIMVTCTVVSENPLVLDLDEGGIHSVNTIELKDKRLVETVKFDTDVPKQACQTYMNDVDYDAEKVSCTGKTIVATSSMEMTETEFKSLEAAFRNQCTQVDGQNFKSK